MGKHKKRKKIINNTIIEVNNENIEDIEQRRSNRLSAILAIIAVSGTIYSIIYNYAKGFLNIYAPQGIIFGIFRCLFFVALSAIILTMFDIVSFIFSDLNRYNILTNDYVNYDEKSDKKYNTMIKNFFFYISVLLYFYFFLIMMFGFLDEDVESKVISLVILCMMIYLAYHLIYLAVKRGEIKKYLVIILRGFIVFLVCMLFVANMIDNRKSLISVKFQSDGSIVIFDETVYKYDNFTIQIYNLNNQLVFSKNISYEEVLYASEDSYITNKVGEEWIEKGHVIDAQERYWKYCFFLDDIITVDGKYQIQIDVEEEKSSVLLKNDFYKQDNIYVFSIENTTKEY